MGSSSGQYRSAIASLIATTGALPSLSRSVRERPANTGISITLKYDGVTILRFTFVSSIPAWLSTWVVPMDDPFSIGTQAAAATRVTPGSAASRSYSS